MTRAANACYASKHEQTKLSSWLKGCCKLRLSRKKILKKTDLKGQVLNFCEKLLLVILLLKNRSMVLDWLRTVLDFCQKCGVTLEIRKALCWLTTAFAKQYMEMPKG